MSADLDFLTETLEKASKELRGRFGGTQVARFKKDKSLVTDADLASEKVILSQLSKYFPKDAVISEESGHLNVSRTPGQRVWIVDPLDGTTNFANGFPFFGVSIGLGRFTEQKSIEIQAGGIIDPIHQNLYLAARGKGATRNGTSIHVQNPRPFEQSFLVTGFYYPLGQDLDREVERFRLVAQKCQSIRRDGSAALDLALVASGVYDGFWERGLAIWDVAAGSLLVEEARGVVHNYPNSQVNSASSQSISKSVSFNIEADGIVAGTSIFVQELEGFF